MYDLIFKMLKYWFGSFDGFPWTESIFYQCMTAFPFPFLMQFQISHYFFWGRGGGGRRLPGRTWLWRRGNWQKWSPWTSFSRSKCLTDSNSLEDFLWNTDVILQSSANLKCKVISSNNSKDPCRNKCCHSGSHGGDNRGHLVETTEPHFVIYAF